MSLFDSYEPYALDVLFGSSSPAQFQIGLSTSPINDDGSGISEPGGGGYSRLTFNNDASIFPPAGTVAGVTTKVNGLSFTWTAATGSWGTVTHWFIYDFVNAKNVIHGALSAPKAVNSGDIFRIPSGTMVLTVD